MHTFTRQIKSRLLACLFIASSYFAAYANAESKMATNTALEVIDSYLEIHTGPGRGYPVFFVIEQGEQIEILARRPDWYEVKSRSGNIGWVKASQIARTLQTTGEPVDLPNVSFGDYGKNRWRLNIVAGLLTGDVFKTASTFNVGVGYYPLSWLGTEFELGKFYDEDAHGSQTSLNLIFEPLTEWRLSPALILGVGQTKVEVQPKIISSSTFEKEAHRIYGIRLNYYIVRNFIVRGEFRKLDITTDNGGEEFQLWNLGFSTFF